MKVLLVNRKGVAGAFDFVIEDPRFEAIKRSVRSVVMPKLACMGAMRDERLSFYEAAEGDRRASGLAMSLGHQFIVKTWINRMERTCRSGRGLVAVAVVGTRLDRLARLRAVAGEMDEALREEGFDAFGSHAVFFRWQRALVEVLGAILVEAERELGARVEGLRDDRKVVAEVSR